MSHGFYYLCNPCNLWLITSGVYYNIESEQGQEKKRKEDAPACPYGSVGTGRQGLTQINTDISVEKVN